jgi:hypothetical protein
MVCLHCLNYYCRQFPSQLLKQSLMTFQDLESVFSCDACVDSTLLNGFYCLTRESVRCRLLSTPERVRFYPNVIFWGF